MICLHCGGPLTSPRRDSRYCMAPDCRRAAYRAYDAARRVRRDRVTTPIPQPERPDLPPFGAMVYDFAGERVQCHACGRYYQRLQNHIPTHGLDAAAYRERYGLTRKQSLAAPAISTRLSRWALAHDLGELGRQAIIDYGNTAGRPRGTAARFGERIGRSRPRRE